MKNKKTIRHQLMRELHPNRWFIWAIVVIVLSGAALLGYAKWVSLRLDSDSVFSDLKTKKIYTDKSGWSVRYPNGWVIERDSANNPVFENPKNLDESLTITRTVLSSETQIRHSLNIINEKDIAKENLKIALIESKEKDGSTLNAAIIKSKSHLYYIYGHSVLLESFARNFKSEAE